MKRILTILAILIATTLFAQNTYVPDDNFEQALIDLGYDSGVLDNFVPTANISGITSLDVSNKNIGDLTGIQDFTALVTLNCENNSIQNLNLTTLTNLENLYCSHNLLSNYIDVSQNTALKILYCGYNSLSIFDLSQNLALERLSCYVNQLSTLDVSVNTALVSLKCQSNQLTELNVKNGANTNIPNANFIATNNPNLTCIEVDDAAWSTTNWTNIDATANFSEHCVGGVPMTYVPDDNFETYLETHDANGNLFNMGFPTAMGNGVMDDYVPTAKISGITSLNVGNKNISDLTGIEDFTALTSLTFSYNNIQSVDISNNTALTELYCLSNQLLSLDLSNNTLLTTVKCHYNQLTDLDVSANTALEILWCQQNTSLNNLNVSGASALTNLSCSDTALTNIDVSNNTNLIELKCGNSQIASLDVSNNTALTLLWCQNSQLTSLNVKNGNNTNVVNADFDATNNLNLTCIEVDDAAWSTTNWTNIDATASFSEHCVGGIPMTYVPDDNFEQALIDLGYDSGALDDYVPTANISGITLLDVNTKNIADLTGIQDFVALTDLRCYSNQLTSLDVTANTALMDLRCFSNQLTSLDVTNNTALTDLRCFSNQLTSLDVTTNTALTILNCSSNQLTSLDVTTNTALTILYCYSNQLTSLDVTTNTALTKLDCIFNQLTSLDVTTNTALNWLYCSYNQLTSLDVTTNTTLTKLYCSYNQLTSLDLTTNTALIRLESASNQLTSLDLTTNTALIRLECSSNQLTSLDLTNNTALIWLYCSSNELTSLDLTTNTTLTRLDCSSNQLTSLNVKNGNNTNMPNANFNATSNSNLTCIEVDDAAWSTTNWTNIDATASFSEHCVGGVPMTYIPDDNFEQALIDLGYDSGALDDYVPTANISGVTILAVNSKNIADLTGIQDFAALTELYCLSNQLTDLDLTQNMHLEKLNCASNSLASVSFNANVSLTHLNIANNQFTSLDVFNYTSLLLLSTSNNLLTSLDVSNNINLSFLMCDGNQLTELNVKNGNNTNIVNTNFNATNNPNLNCILVDDATYSTTNWTNIDATSTFVNNQAECDALSVADNTFETQLSLYPNPVKNSFTIQNNSNYTIEKLSIYTILGKLVLQTNNVNAPINVSQLKNGVYLVKITSDSKTAVQKIVINK